MYTFCIYGDLSFLYLELHRCIMHVCMMADLKPLLTPEVVTELVIATMRHVPAMPPSTFGSSYTPIAAAGTESQVRISGCGS